MNNMQLIDFAVLDWIQAYLKGPILDIVMPIISYIGNSPSTYSLKKAQENMYRNGHIAYSMSSNRQPHSKTTCRKNTSVRC